MTPAITALDKAQRPYQLHEYTHDPATDSFGREACEKLNLDPARVFKTLVIKLESQDLAVAVLPVSQNLNLKDSARHLGAKKAQMADPLAVERSTGYVLGGVSPIGQKKLVPTLIDQSATTFDTIFVSGGRRGLEIELRADDLRELTNGRYASLGVSKK